MAQRSHQRRSAAQWQELVKQQAIRGSSQAAFCAEQGLALSTFQYWKRRLKRALRVQAAPSPMFTALDQPAASASPCNEDGPPTSGWTVELDLGDGVCLRLSRTP